MGWMGMQSGGCGLTAQTTPDSSLPRWLPPDAPTSRHLSTPCRYRSGLRPPQAQRTDSGRDTSGATGVADATAYRQVP